MTIDQPFVGRVEVELPILGCAGVGAIQYEPQHFSVRNVRFQEALPVGLRHGDDLLRLELDYAGAEVGDQKIERFVRGRLRHHPRPGTTFSRKAARRALRE